MRRHMRTRPEVGEPVRQCRKGGSAGGQCRGGGLGWVKEGQEDRPSSSTAQGASKALAVCASSLCMVVEEEWEGHAEDACLAAD